MSYADITFKNMCRKIIDEGEVVETRAMWEDTNTHACTKHIFGIATKYDLQKEFPLLTLRKTGTKNAIDEILWIWQKKSNNINDLNSHIWDAWADNHGEIGKAYGYQVGHKKQTVYTTLNRILEINPNYLNNNDDAILHEDYDKYEKYQLDQMDYILHELKFNPTSRRIIGNLYNVEDLDEMNLHPCCYSITFGVINGKLNMIVNQRSQDMLVANNWNVFQYSVLLMMIAQVTGYEVGEMIHIIGDVHIYDRHIEIVEEILKNEEYPAPKVELNKDIKNFYDFTVDDVVITDYKYNELDTKIQVAV